MGQRVLAPSVPQPKPRRPPAPPSRAVPKPLRALASGNSRPSAKAGHPACPVPAAGPATSRLRVRIRLSTNGSRGRTGKTSQPGCSGGAGTAAKAAGHGVGAAAPRLVDRVTWGRPGTRGLFPPRDAGGPWRGCGCDAVGCRRGHSSEMWERAMRVCWCAVRPGGREDQPLLQHLQIPSPPPGAAEAAAAPPHPLLI